MVERMLGSLVMVAGILSGFSSCSSEELDGIDSDKELVDVTLSITSRADADDPESQIKSLRVYAFDGERFVDSYEKQNLAGSSHEFKMHLSESDITFYVIANEAAAGDLKVQNGDKFEFSNFDKDKITAERLKAITFSQLPKNVSKNGIPMTAVNTITVEKDKPVIIDNLKKSVAKLTIYVIKKSVAKPKNYAIKKGSDGAYVFINRGIYLYNEPQYGYLFANQTLYNGSFNHRESEQGYQTDGDNQKNGKIILSADWKNDSNGTIKWDKDAPNGTVKKWGKNIVTENYTVGMAQDPSRYNMIPKHSFYLFPNPNEYEAILNDGKTQNDDRKTNAYYLKFGWTSAVTNNGKTSVKAPDTHPVPLSVVSANDNLRLFAHISLTNTITDEFNWFVTDWISGGGEIEFN